jgi:hypothetical protein
MTLSARRDLAAPSKFFASARLRADTIPVEVTDHAGVPRVLDEPGSRRCIASSSMRIIRVEAGPGLPRPEAGRARRVTLLRKKANGLAGAPSRRKYFDGQDLPLQCAHPIRQYQVGSDDQVRHRPC